MRRKVEIPFLSRMGYSRKRERNVVVTMKNLRRIVSAFLGAVLLLALPVTALALSLDDPCLTVRVCFPPKGLALSLTFDESVRPEPMAAEPDRRLGEGCYRFYYKGVPMSWKSGLPPGTELVAETPADGVICRLPAESLTGFESVYTLDLQSQSIWEGMPWYRTPLLLSLRIGLTLLLQLLSLYLLGYRARRSWIILSAVLLFNHLFLNIGVVAGASTVLAVYVGWVLAAAVLAELFLFVIESAVLSLLLLEGGERRAVKASALINGLFAGICAVFVFFLPM